ncbi:Hypothetical protein A7982_11762 [Minicystis rosea]|nr:Hypothetical protein A7982_11762 [Minicystis rosea]
MKSRITQMLAGAMALPMVAEGAARIALRRYGGYYRYVPNTRLHMSIDRAALPRLRPVARVEINRDGERGGPPPRDDEKALRALVVGGSAAECLFLDQDQTWGAVVERTLSEPRNLRALGVSRVHVGIVARAIVPCAHIDLSLQKMLPRYPKLDLVLVMVGASDVVSWMEQGLPRTFDHCPPDLDKLFEQHPEGPWGPALERTALRRIAASLYRNVRHPIAEIGGGGDWLHRTRKMRAEAERIIDEEPDATPMLDNFAQHLTALLHTAQSGATRVILVRQPWLGCDLGPEEQRLLWNFGLGRPYREKVTSYFSARVVDALMRRIDARAAAVADRMGVQHVDLLPDLERSARTFYDCLHFTPEGAETVGRLVADAIVHPAPRVVRPRAIAASERR